MSAGYQEVDALMDKVYKAIGRHLPQSSDGAVDIYNRAYETVTSIYLRLVAVTAERDRYKKELSSLQLFVGGEVRPKTEEAQNER